MKTATLPAVRVSPDLRALAESVLHEGETLSMFMEESVRQHATWRKEEAEFYARGLASAKKARETGNYVGVDAVLAGLRNVLQRHKDGDGAGESLVQK